MDWENLLINAKTLQKGMLFELHRYEASVRVINDKNNFDMI